MARFADRLKELRQRAGLTQQQLAAQSGFPVGTIQGYEQGKREPYWHVVPQLAEALGVTCEAFADVGQGAKKPARPATRNGKAKGK